ncbi:5-(carboxyamino)imidazole ribonucleotide synthase [Meiothermus granaticius]|uniref:N5-carboxyaminoimidazole ribonucleotide synthase n=1 Tax=Meiothermus granaticius NBRC 107808 TaxID=1227551 RepID=A0A399FCW5_9DEIN|nr:5-(carboxyamino)imidazole ribonucleotide synthase [Meiothermus granaticius]MCL6526505.1 5-(carboxyamino)imidazole ribonucleotide synthase [Thermaceae bacterium]RIH92872.1 N5-carboxyaminoimidazole ribonucleotide synthase [Meiothermus granaticius NBRC 107808]GEM86728.1 N5-carboxyaminoimidazole ribonucleotide synthase [Meiothermus granaticius NBRC 107808]
MRIGVLGAGQLGRMLALAGLPLGLEFRFFDTTAEAPAGQLAELQVGSYDDPTALAGFAEGCDCITYEFENVPVGATRFLAERVPVYPPPQALEVAQDRVVEKTFLGGLGLPTPVFYPVLSKNDLLDGLERTGLPAVLKTRTLGYDGKGQRVLREQADIDPAWTALGGQPLILEGWVPFEREVSSLAVRSRSGETAFYPLVENTHREGILRQSWAPAPALSPELQAQAEAYTLRVLERLEYVGVLAIEWFQVGGQLLANEMAPRVHNSGHWTIEGAETSQFENHLRALLGWPLGASLSRGHAAMLNLIGQQPEAARVLAVPGAHLHWYGKALKPGRKVGHITVRADSAEVLAERVAAVGALL